MNKDKDKIPWLDVRLITGRDTVNNACIVQGERSTSVGIVLFRGRGQRMEGETERKRKVRGRERER